MYVLEADRFISIFCAFSQKVTYLTAELNKDWFILFM